MSSDQMRVTRAKARQAEADQRTPEQQLANLDRLFGPGQGAAKERAKLARRIEARDAERAEKERLRSLKEKK